LLLVDGVVVRVVVALTMTKAVADTIGVVVTVAEVLTVVAPVADVLGVVVLLAVGVLLT
jgi:hypothetical protein